MARDLAIDGVVKQLQVPAFCSRGFLRSVMDFFILNDFWTWSERFSCNSDVQALACMPREVGLVQRQQI